MGPTRPEPDLGQSLPMSPMSVSPIPPLWTGTVWPLGEAAREPTWWPLSHPLPQRRLGDQAIPRGLAWSFTIVRVGTPGLRGASSALAVGPQLPRSPPPGCDTIVRGVGTEMRARARHQEAAGRGSRDTHHPLGQQSCVGRGQESGPSRWAGLWLPFLVPASSLLRRPVHLPPVSPPAPPTPGLPTAPVQLPPPPSSQPTGEAQAQGIPQERPQALPYLVSTPFRSTRASERAGQGQQEEQGQEEMARHSGPTSLMAGPCPRCPGTPTPSPAAQQAGLRTLLFNPGLSSRRGVAPAHRPVAGHRESPGDNQLVTQGAQIFPATGPRELSAGPVLTRRESWAAREPITEPNATGQPHRPRVPGSRGWGIFAVRPTQAL